MAALKSTIEKKNKIQSGLREKIGAFEELIKDRRKNIDKIKSLGKNSDCPTCLQPLKEAYDKVLPKLNNEIEQYQTNELASRNKKLKVISEEIIKLKKQKLGIEDTLEDNREDASDERNSKTRLREIKKELEGLKEKQKKLQKDINTLGSIKYDAVQHSAICKKLKELEKAHKRYEKLGVLIERIPEVKKDLKDLNVKKENLATELLTAQKRIKKIPYSEKKHTAAASAQDAMEIKKDKSYKLLNQKKDNLKDIMHSIDMIAEELKRDQTQRERVKKDQEEYQALDKLDKYMDDFKEIVLDEVRPLISSQASQLFQDITCGRYEAIDVDENFDFFIFDSGSYFPIKRFSGGEVDLANICLRVAISKAIIELSGGGSVGLLGFDEIFGSQDTGRRMEILSAFHKLKEQYRQIFIISHIDGMKEDFPNIMEVAHSAGRSTIRWISKE